MHVQNGVTSLLILHKTFERLSY